MVEIMGIIGLSFFAYLLGSIPFGYYIARAKGVEDIRKIGSGSTGGTNVGRTLGKGYGLLVAFLDGLKCLFPTFLALKVFGIDWIISLVILLVVLGHIFSIWLKFRGGKGVASAIGGLILIVPPLFLLVEAIVWLACFLIKRYVSLANLVMLFFIPLILWLTYHSWIYLLFGVVLFAIIAWAHRDNIVRIIQGTERRIRFPDFLDFSY